ncbi:hypothetical protein MKY84_13510 [Chryseomicrobium sp. FSL W7-1435]|uniref:hypothetical protein n=1 Tax=Chryseomicrobium sp. FSL W7-1435 TaxID=2921704 RepID=UPI00315ACC2D
MYILGFLLAVLTFGILADLRRGSFRSRKAHDTNPNNVKSPDAAHNAYNTSHHETYIP